MNDENIDLNKLIFNLKKKLNDTPNQSDSPCEKNDIDLNSILNQFSETDNNDNENSSCSSTFNFNNVLESLGSEDPRKNLLLSLKPFLKKSRQNKIDTYISLLSLSSIFKISNIFTSESSDKDVWF